MGILGKIFGTEEAISKSIDLIASAGDKLVYTDEEKADDKAKRAAQIDTLLIRWMETTTGQNLARRLLAVMITCVWVLMFFASTIGDMIVPFLSLSADPEFINAWKESSAAIDKRAEQMTGAMMLILPFYFSLPYMGTVIDGAMSKFGNKSP